MNESQPASDDQLSLKKRARRRLIGAIVFVTFAAVVLPMVMDEEAPPASPSIELNIPAQDKGFAAPATGVAEPVPAVVSPRAVPLAPDVRTPMPPVASGNPPASGATAVAEKSTEPTKVLGEPPVTPGAKPAKPETKPAKAEPAKPVLDAKRAQALLEGNTPAPAGDGPHVVLIGAFANAGNVQVLQKKLSEMGIKVYTETLDSPQGRKTRVRAGPFPSRAAAEKAAARMKSIGIAGVVAAKP